MGAWEMTTPPQGRQKVDRQRPLEATLSLVADNGTLAHTTHQVILDEPGFLIWKLHLAILPAPWAAFPTAVCLVVLTWPH